MRRKAFKYAGGSKNHLNRPPHQVSLPRCNDVVEDEVPEYARTSVDDKNSTFLSLFSNNNSVSDYSPEIFDPECLAGFLFTRIPLVTISLLIPVALALWHHFAYGDSFLMTLKASYGGLYYGLFGYFHMPPELFPAGKWFSCFFIGLMAIGNIWLMNFALVGVFTLSFFTFLEGILGRFLMYLLSELMNRPGHTLFDLRNDIREVTGLSPNLEKEGSDYQFLSLLAYLITYTFYRLVMLVFSGVDCLPQGWIPIRVWTPYTGLPVVTGLGRKWSKPCKVLSHINDFRKYRDVRFISRDTSQDSNRRQVNRPLGVPIRVFGITILGDRIYKFPVTCDQRTFLRFLEWAQINLDAEDRKDLFAHGLVQPLAREAFASIYYQPLPQVLPCEGLGNDLDSVEFVSTILEVLWLCKNKDLVGLTLFAGSHASLFRTLYDLASVPDPRSLIEAFNFDDEDVVEGLAPSMYDLLGILPGRVKKAPLVVKVVSLVSFLLASQVGADLPFVRSLTNGVDYSAITETVFGASLITQVLSSVWNGVTAFASSGDFMSFLGVPRDVAFLRSSAKLLYSVVEGQSHEDIMEDVVKIRELIASREFCTNSIEITRDLEKLKALELTKMTFLRANVKRVQPKLIFLCGAPGTGKTTLNNEMVEFLTRSHGLERFVGDVINCKIDSKYPVESGGHERARFIVMNDVPDDYTQFPSQGRTSLDIMMQKILDTDVLTFDAADIADKKRIYTDVMYLIVTTNFTNFVFPNPVEKLDRRISDGLVMYCSFAGGLAYRDVSKMKQSARNQHTLFHRMGLKIEHNRLELSRTSVGGSYSFLFNDLSYLSERYLSDVALLRAKFDNLDAKCTCGVSDVLHSQVVDGKAYDWYPISPDCESPAPVFPAVPDQMRRALLLKEALEGIQDRVENGIARAVENISTLTSLLPTPPDFSQSTEDIVAERLSYVVDGLSTEVVLAVSVTALVFSWGAVFGALYALYFAVMKVCNEFVATSKESALRGVLALPTPIRRRVMDDCSEYVAQQYVKYYPLYRRVKRFVAEHKAKIALFLTGGGILSYFALKMRSKELGPVLSRSTVLDASMETSVVPGPWTYTPSLTRSWAATEPVQHLKLEALGVGQADLISLAKKSYGDFKMSAPEGTLRVRGIFMSPHWVALNSHYFDSFGSLVTVECDGISQAIKVSDAVPLSKSEFVLIPNVWRPACANLFSKCLFEPPEIDLDLLVVGPSNKMCVGSKQTVCLPHPNGQKRVYDGHFWNGVGEKGDCGTLVLGSSGGHWFIVGAVAFGSTNYLGTFSRVGLSYLCLSHFPDRGPFDLPQIQQVVVTGLRDDLLPLSAEGEFCLQPNKYMTPFGSSCEGGSSFETSFRRTRLFEDVVASGRLSEPYLPPKTLGGMVPSRDGEVYKSAWRSTFKNVDLPCLAPASLWVDAVNQYLDDFLKFRSLHPEEIRLSPLPLAEGFWGKFESGIDKVPMATSNGVTWRELGKSKKADLFDRIDDDGFALNPVFREHCERRIASLRKGVVHTPLVELVPKDEIRPKVKIDDYKIRLFAVLDFDFNLVFRMFVMPLITVLLQHPEFSECYGGMNAGSTQWSDLARRLLSKGGKVTDLDFSSFDVSHAILAFLSVALFFYKLALALGYTREDADVVALLVMSLCVQLMKYKKDYFLKIKGMPSGVIVTLILNSLVNSFLMRMAFAVLVPLPLSAFTEHVAAATVGDDNASGISDDVIDHFNMIAIAPLYASWGYVITPASKGGEFQKFLSLEEITFVKRRFQLWDDGWYRAPIASDTLVRPLLYEQLEKGTTSAERLKSVYRSCVREAYLWGESYFNDYVAWIDGLFLKHSLSVDKSLTFDSLNKEFLAGSFRTFSC